MARGWESKSVEQQQAGDVFPDPDKQLLSPDQIAKHRRRKGLQLSRQNVLQRLHATGDPRQRRMLEQALADLDCQIAQLA
jgi:hypothetical protein